MKNKLVLKPHQNKAKQDILYSATGLLNNNRAKFISACGTGKTLSALVTCEEYIFDIVDTQNSKIAFFYPTLALVSQSFKTYVRESRIDNYKPLFICSDKSIAAIDDEDITLDEFKEEIGDYPVTTNAEDVIAYLLDESIEHKVIYSTYQSSHILAKVTMQLNMRFNFSTFDEAHNVALKNNSKESAQTVILHDIDFPNEFGMYFECDKRLFMTATPKHFELKDEDSNDISFEETRLVYSMDDERYFGGVAHEYSVREAINEGVIADYQIIAIYIDDEYIKSFKEEFKSSDEDLFDEVKTYAVVKAIKKYNIDKTIIFNKTINKSIEFTKLVSKLDNKLNIEHIDGKMPHNVKQEILTNFRDEEKMILSNSKLLSEGIDVPTVGMVGFLANTSSSFRDIVQRVGRCQRIPSGQSAASKIGYVFIPLIVSSTEDQGQAEFNRTNSDARNLYGVINSLREMDSQLDYFIEYKIKNLTVEDYDNLLQDLVIAISQKDTKETKRLEKLIRTYEQCNQQPPIKIENIRSFVNENNKSNRINSDKKEGNIDAYEFQSKIINFIDATLLGESSLYENSWESKFIELKNYLEINKKYPSDKDNSQLASWVRANRSQYNNNKLKFQRVLKLRTIDSNFFPEIREFMTTNDYIELLKDYLKEYSIYEIKYSTVFKNVKLGMWVVKKVNEIINDEINTETKMKLEKLGFTLDFINEKKVQKDNSISWDEKYQILKEWVKDNDLTNISSTLVYKNIKLGLWVISNRAEYKKNNIPLKRIQQFLELDKNFFESKFTFVWEDNFKKLAEYYSEGIDNLSKKDKKIFSWFNDQKKRRNSLTEEQVQKLLSLDENIFVSLKELTWYKKLLQAVEYKELINDDDKNVFCKNIGANKTSFEAWIRYQLANQEKLTEFQLNKLTLLIDKN